MEKQEKYTMALFKVNGHYITYVEGYVEAENVSDAQQKSGESKLVRSLHSNWQTMPRPFGSNLS